MVNPYNWKISINWDDMGEGSNNETIWMPRIQLVDELGGAVMTFEGNSFEQMITIASITISMIQSQLSLIGETGRFIDWATNVNQARDALRKQMQPPSVQ